MTRSVAPGKPVRVLILPAEVAGYGAGLQAGLRERGHAVDLLLLYKHPFEYPHEPPRSRVFRALTRAVQRRQDEDDPTGPFFLVWERLLRLIATVVIASRYDAVVYLYGMSLIRGADVLVARIFGCTTIVVYMGSDARPPYLDGLPMAPDGEHHADFHAIARSSRQKARLVRRMERVAHYTINNPPTAQFHRRPYLDFSGIGVPVLMPSAPELVGEGISANVPLRIVHAPSAPVHKGSATIRAAIEQLALEGIAVELIELSGVSNRQVHEALDACDLVVDQLYSDNLLAGLATEAAHHQRPVLVFGYAGAILARVAERISAPIAHYGDPADLVHRLRHYLNDPAARASLASELATFVRAQWSPNPVAERFERLFARSPDPSWWNQPDEFGYEHGFGLSWSRMRALVVAYVDDQGEDALALSPDSPTRHLINAQRDAIHSDERLAPDSKGNESVR